MPDIRTQAIEDERYGPNKMEVDARALLERLKGEKAQATDPAWQREIAQRMKVARTLIRFAVTRAGYVKAAAKP